MKAHTEDTDLVRRQETGPRRPTRLAEPATWRFDLRGYGLIFLGHPAGHS